MTHVPLLNQAAKSSPAKALPLLQRNRTALCQSKSRKQIESVKGTLSSSGQPLDLNTKVFFENQFEKDFSHVRVHSNSKSAHSANAISAAAYTVGSSIAFGRNQYQPNTVGGRRLLAHELTHVAQNGNRSLDLGNLKLGPLNCPTERQAASNETTFGSAYNFKSPTIGPTNENVSSIIRRKSFAQQSGGNGQSMASHARQDALSIIDVLTEFHISDKQESEVIKTLQDWGRISTQDENYLDIILTILQGRSLTMKYLGLFESAPSTYLDQLFEEMEDERSLDLRELIQTHSTKFASYRNRKGVSVFGSVTSAVVNEARSFQEFLISKMRNMISELAGQERSIAEAVLDLIEGISDVLIGTLFFLTGVVSGVFSEIWSMIEGFAQLILGILKALWLLVSNFEKFKENGAALLDALWNLPRAIKALIAGWQEEFGRSTEDRQIVMIGELTGQIIAAILTSGFTVTKAGKVSKLRLPKKLSRKRSSGRQAPTTVRLADQQVKTMDLSPKITTRVSNGFVYTTYRRSYRGIPENVRKTSYKSLEAKSRKAFVKENELKGTGLQAGHIGPAQGGPPIGQTMEEFAKDLENLVPQSERMNKGINYRLMEDKVTEYRRKNPKKLITISITTKRKKTDRVPMSRSISIRDENNKIPEELSQFLEDGSGVSVIYINAFKDQLK